MSRTSRVLIADSDTDFSRNLEAFLNNQADIRVVNIVRDGQGAIDACQETLPDLVLIDLHLPVLDSIRTIQTILTQNEHIRLLGVSSTPNDRYAIEAVKAGAHGFIEKNGGTNNEQIADAIRQVLKGEVVLNSTLASHILQEFS